MQRIGPYEVLEELARGGQGVVLQARDPSGTTVVLKLLLDPNAQTRARFLREGQTLAALHHPNLLRVFDLGQLPNGTPYMVMEFIPGRNLADRVRTGGIPSRDAAVSTLESLADTLHYCHEQGLVHRDVKPKNVMLEEGSDRVVLVDFGLIKRDRLRAAWSTQDRQSLTVEGSTVGTPEYMPPEQVSVKHGEVDRRSDVYALGAVLYFLLTGDPPFQGATPINVILKVLQADPPDPRAVDPDLPAPLAELCRQCMAKDMAERPASAQAFADALRASLPRSSGDSRRRWGVMVAVATLGVLAGAVVIGRTGSDPEESVTQAETETETESEAEAESESETETESESESESESETESETETESEAESESETESETETESESEAREGPAPAVGRLMPQALAAKKAGRLQEAVALYRQAAEQGSPEAMFNLAGLLERGRGAPRDETRAVEWYRRAADARYPPAMYELTKRLEKGRGVPKDVAQAALWLRRTAEAGNEYAMQDLAKWLEKGRGGLSPDARQAVAWFRRSAEKGNIWAMHDLAQRLARGGEVPRDDAQAEHWFRRAAEGGNQWAMYDLGRKLDEGRGVLQDETEAARWFRQAAEKGHAWAMYSLGQSLARGRGVPRDEAEAARWLHKAAEDEGVRGAAEAELKRLSQ